MKIRDYLIVFFVLLFFVALIYRIQDNSKDLAREIPILTYHRICSDEEFKKIKKEKDLYVKESDFKEEMKWLHDNGYTTLSLEEFYQWFNETREFPKKTVVITFDDGTYGIIDYALPILKQYNLKATVFVIGDLMGTSDGTMDGIKYIGSNTINRIGEEYPNLNFQSHTLHMHRLLENDVAAVFESSDWDLLEDFVNMDKKMKKHLDGYKMEFLAYPYGKYTTQMQKYAKMNGIKMAFTYNDQILASRSNNIYLIPRIGIDGTKSKQESFYRWFK